MKHIPPEEFKLLNSYEKKRYYEELCQEIADDIKSGKAKEDIWIDNEGREHTTLCYEESNEERRHRISKMHLHQWKDRVENKEYNRKMDERIKINEEDKKNWFEHEFDHELVESQPGWITHLKHSNQAVVKFRYNHRWFATYVDRFIDMKKHIHNKDLIIVSGTVATELYNPNCFLVENVVFGEKRPRKKKSTKAKL